MYRSFAVLALGTALIAAGDSAPGLKTIRADALKGHLFFLASDAMAGRDSMSREGRIAADYIAGFFYRAGLKPVGDNNTFFQNFPMVDARIDRENTRLAARVASKTDGHLQRDYANGPDFTLPRQGNVDVACWRLSSSPATASARPSTTTTTSKASTSLGKSSWC